MTSSLTIPAATGSTTVTIERPLQDDFAEQPGGHRELEAGSGCWGVTAEGQAYFDPDGSVDGEHAVLVADDRGELFLVPQGSGFGVEARRPDGHRFPGHHRIEGPHLRSAANRDEPGHLFPGHLPPRERVVPPLPRRKDGRVFGPVAARRVEREYDRREDGTLIDAPAVQGDVREVPRGEDGRVMGPAEPQRTERSYQRRDDGRLLEPAPPLGRVRELARRENGRTHPPVTHRRFERTYPTRERQQTAFTGRDRAR